jgi:hypothetical protein
MCRERGDHIPCAFIHCTWCVHIFYSFLFLYMLKSFSRSAQRFCPQKVCPVTHHPLPYPPADSQNQQAIRDARLQCRTIKVNKSDCRRTRIFRVNLSSDSDSQTSKRVKKPPPKFFPRHFSCGQNFEVKK